MNGNQTIGVFTPQDAAAIKKKVLHGDYGQSQMRYTDRKKFSWHYVILKEALLPATDPLTGYTQAEAAALMYLEATDTLDMEEITDVDSRFTITNRSPYISGSVGDVALIRFIVKEWAPVWCAASTLRHGIVRDNLGCGYYSVELAIWTGDRFSSGSGIGSDPSSGEDRNCDICYDVVGSGTSACGITLSYPPLQVTGIGEYVIAYHRASALVPLHTGTACMMTGSGADSPSSVELPDTDTLGVDNVWQIVDGLQDHTVQYIEEWDCCDPDGPETLLTRTPVIFAAKVCEAIPCGECPTSSV